MQPKGSKCIMADLIALDPLRRQSIARSGGGKEQKTFVLLMHTVCAYWFPWNQTTPAATSALRPQQFFGQVTLPVWLNLFSQGQQPQASHWHPERTPDSLTVLESIPHADTSLG